MTGPEHYAEAERLIDDAHEAIENDPPVSDSTVALIAEAQVHATLALAAATAHRIPPLYDPRWTSWRAADDPTITRIEVEARPDEIEAYKRAAAWRAAIS